MNQRNALVRALLVALGGGLLVLFTDVEVGLVKWVNCGPLAAPSSMATTGALP